LNVAAPIALFLLVVAVLWILIGAGGLALTRTLRAPASQLAAWLSRRFIRRLGERRAHLVRFAIILIPIVAGLVVTFAAGNIFLELAELLQSHNPALDEIDRTVHASARNVREEWLTNLFTILTIIGTPLFLGIISVALSVGLILRARYRWAAYLLTTGVLGGLLNLALKDYFERERPLLSEALRSASGFSFPSGHAMGSMIVFSAISYLTVRTGWRWRWKSLALALSVTMILTIALSRIYLGVHWISDIAAGIAAGAVWVTSTTAAYETFRRLRRVRGERT
jgi:undecaprenyl-diphosphatase